MHIDMAVVDVFSSFLHSPNLFLSCFIVGLSAHVASVGAFPSLGVGEAGGGVLQNSRERRAAVVDPAREDCTSGTVRVRSITSCLSREICISICTLYAKAFSTIVPT